MLSEMHGKLLRVIEREESGDIERLHFDDAERFMSWVYSIARNNTINESRLKRNTLINRDEFALESADRYSRNNVIQPCIDTQDFAEELKLWLVDYFGNKPKSHKVVFESVFYGQKTYEESGRIASVPCGTVKTIIHASRNAIKEKFGNQYNHLIKEIDGK